MTNSYSADSIQSLGVLGGVRAKPASVGIESHNHTFLEILGNSIDEANAGHGETIVITKNEDKSVTIRDYGRGVPMDKNSEGEYAYKKIFDELWSGAKYSNDDNEDGDYQYSLGTNGLGACATNYTSDFFKAYSYSDKWVRVVEYEKGVESKGGLQKTSQPEDSEPVGTSITWRPSKEVFRGKGEIDDDFIVSTLKDQSIVNGGLKFIFINKNDLEEDLESGEMIPYEVEFYYENGVSDYIESMTSNEDNRISDVVSLTTERRGKDDGSESDLEYRIRADIFFAFNREVSYNRYYHNSSWLENKGTPEDFIRNSFTFVIDKHLKDNGMYNKSEKKVTFDDIADSLIVITSTYSTISLFTDQTKKRIGSDFMRKSITEWLREQLSIYLIENPLEAERILNQVLINKRSRETAENTRMNVRKKLSGKVDNITNRIDGFVNCKSRDSTETELFIVEGKSALGSTKQGRNAQIQSIYALRGKILNCLKADYDRIFKNDIIVDLIKILGCGVEVKSRNKDLNTFDINNLRWSKVIITTDADVDGFHIRTLVLTMIYRLMPTLITEGKVFIGESPLYEIQNKDDTYFAYSDKERDDILSKLSGSVNIQRSKGLGENTAEMMWDTTMNPETRRVIQVTKDDVERTQETFELLLGDNLEGRKKFIEDNLFKYVEEALD